MEDGFEVSYSLETEQQFWEELNDVVTADCSSHELIDNALRTYLHFTTNFRDEYLDTDYSLARCTHKLLESEVFGGNKDYVRIQIVYSLLQEDEFATLHIIANFLLFDGKHNEATFERMIHEGCFPRLLELISRGKDEDPRLHRMLLELMYEMSRVQRLTFEDLAQVDDGFVTSLFQLIEQLSDDVDDPYHYPVIRVLLVLNEQFMVAATTTMPTSPGKPAPPPLTNRVIKVLSLHGSTFMTFSENIILLLNRETETALQLLILKLLYLLFTTRATHEYFYTNDLRVLLDVIIRNLLDLPSESMALRHTYLRVLYPLLSHTQLSHEPYYKRDEIIKVLAILGGSGNTHWEPADETTLRLVERVAKVSWLLPSSPVHEAVTDAEVARKILGISLTGSQSASVVDVAAVMEKPGVQTPSRKHDGEAEVVKVDIPDIADAEQVLHDLEASHKEKKRKPPPPAKRRHGSAASLDSVVDLGDSNGVSIAVSPPKKLPPKAPPRRRTRLRPMASNADLEGHSGGEGGNEGGL